jgi:hypothetical protein
MRVLGFDFSLADQLVSFGRISGRFGFVTARPVPQQSNSLHVDEQERGERIGNGWLA